MGKQKQCILVFLILVCASFVLLYGCVNQNKEVKEEDSYTIGLVTKSKDSEYWMSVASGAEKAANDYGVSVIIVSPDTESNEKLQKKMIGDLIDKGVDSLAISPIQSYDASEYLKEAREHDVFVVSCDTKIADNTVPYIGIDNYKAGQELAKEMAKRLNNHGQVGIVSGDLSQTTHAERMEGFRSYIEQNTEIDVAFVESGYSNLLMPEEEISRLREEYPQVEGIFATSAVTALGLVGYLNEDAVQIMTVDAQQDALEGVENGNISALAAQSGYEIGYHTIQYIMEHQSDTKLEDEILPSEIVTSDNVKQWESEHDL